MVAVRSGRSGTVGSRSRPGLGKYCGTVGRRSRQGVGVRCVLVAVMLTLVATACTVSKDGTPEPMPAAPSGLEKFYAQTPNWGPCTGFGASGTRFAPSAECTRIDVPVDYEKPDGPTAQIALSRMKATGSRIGSLLLNPGGPGVAGLQMATVGSGTPLEQRFDRVGFDPRGIGASLPSITCLTPQEMDAERGERPFDNDPAGIAAAEADNRQYADRCFERTGSEFLAHVGTREVVQDMDVIRAVLGDPGISYIGYSYGTMLGSAYAEKFPDRVRALVLDAAIDPEQDPNAESLRQAAGFQQAFAAYSAACVQQGECPLGNDPTQTTARFRELVNPLWDKPVPTVDPRGLGYNDATTGVMHALYSDDMWSTLSLGLAELRDGRGDTLLSLADMYEGRAEDGTYSNSQDAFRAIRCVDSPRITDRELIGKQDTEYRRVAPFVDDGRGTGAAPLDMCATWPVPNTSDTHRISVNGLPKTVVVSTTEDPATPYQAGVDLAAQLNAALITYRGTRHTVSLVAGVDCVDRAVVRYLINLTEPEQGLTC